MLTEHGQVSGAGGTTYLRAVTDRNRVRVQVSATVFEDADEAVGS